MISPMLCHDAHGTDVSVIPSGWVMEPKLDGWRWQVVRTPDGIRHIGGRNGREQSGKTPYIDEALMWLPPDTILDGELVARGTAGSSGDTGHALSNQPEVLQYVVFDVLGIAGTSTMDKPWRLRRPFVEMIAENAIAAEQAAYVTCTPSVDVSQLTLDRWIELGGEGAVCKDPEARYFPGKRTRQWLKLKHEETVDCEVIGFKKGKGQSNQHKNAAVLLRTLDTGTETSCGLGRNTDDATANPERWLGQIVEVKCNGRFKDGAPRHPTDLRRRDDLPRETRARPIITRAPIDAAPTATGASRRNYGAMGRAKLEKCTTELAQKSGDAYDRCVSAGADPDADLAICDRLLKEKRFA